FDDRGLHPAENHTYQVRGIFSDGTPSDWSSPVTGTTLSPPFQTTFQKTLDGDEDDWQGQTIVQRIEAGQLSASGIQVQIYVQASSDQAASIDRVFISQPASATASNPTPDPYDSGPDLTPVYNPNPPMPFVVPIGVDLNGQAVLTPLPIVNYTLDHTQP